MKILFFVCFSFFNLFLYSQNYSRVQIFVNDSDLPQLYSLGIDLDHVEYRKNYYIEAELSSSDIQKLGQNGFSFLITVPDLEAFYADQVQVLSTKTGAYPCNNSGSSTNNLITPVNFQLGSMGGYLTYAEYLANLDSMASKYPNLITSKSAISTFLTEENRPLYELIISDNPGTPEGEEQVLYTAIHHAREPASLSQTVFYMWYLLENYATNPEIQYLIDNTEMHFVPLVNPDGYIYNETTNSGGGGMWRKNRRNNGGGLFGVDLNRNYSYQWGVSGTSTDPNSDVYLGTAPFSEVETQAIKWLCENNQFKFAFNAHTNGNLLLHPFGYGTALAADHNYFQGITKHMTNYNGYVAEKSSDLYPAAGDSDDWMYDGDLGTKPKIYAMTPEIGPSAFSFWPPASEIEAICKDNIYQNMRLAHLPHVYGRLQDQESGVITLNADYFNFDLTRFGLTSGDFTVSITPLTGILSVGSPKIITGMAILDLIEDSISYTLLSNLNVGDEIMYLLELNNGTYTSRDTIKKTFGNPTVVFSDNGNNLNNWTSSSWDVTTEEFVSPSTSITDSPNQDYSNNTTSDITSSFTIDLSSSVQASVSFSAMWDIEAAYDYVQFEVSSDNGANWTPMCGNYTVLGTNNQELDEPLYDGVQATWVREEISLLDFLGSQIMFRFQFKSDGFVNGDGFYFDDFTVSSDEFTSIKENDFVFSIFPNPSSDYIYITNNYSNSFQYKLVSLNGQVIHDFTDLNFGQTILNISDLESGMYFLSIHDAESGIVKTEKIIKN